MNMVMRVLNEKIKSNVRMLPRKFNRIAHDVMTVCPKHGKSMCKWDDNVWGETEKNWGHSFEIGKFVCSVKEGHDWKGQGMHIDDKAFYESIGMKFTNHMWLEKLIHKTGLAFKLNQESRSMKKMIEVCNPKEMTVTMMTNDLEAYYDMSGYSGSTMHSEDIAYGKG